MVREWSYSPRHAAAAAPPRLGAQLHAPRLSLLPAVRVSVTRAGRNRAAALLPLPLAARLLLPQLPLWRVRLQALQHVPSLQPHAKRLALPQLPGLRSSLQALWYAPSLVLVHLCGRPGLPAHVTLSCTLS